METHNRNSKNVFFDMITKGLDELDQKNFSFLDSIKDIDINDVFENIDNPNDPKLQFLLEKLLGLDMDKEEDERTLLTALRDVQLNSENAKIDFHYKCGYYRLQQKMQMLDAFFNVFRLKFMKRFNEDRFDFKPENIDLALSQLFKENKARGASDLYYQFKFQPYGKKWAALVDAGKITQRTLYNWWKRLDAETHKETVEIRFVEAQWQHKDAEYEEKVERESIMNKIDATKWRIHNR